MNQGLDYANLGTGCVEGWPGQRGDERELLGHGAEDTELLQVPQLEGRGGEGDDKVLSHVGDTHHAYGRLVPAVLPQVFNFSAKKKKKILQSYKA